VADRGVPSARNSGRHGPEARVCPARGADGAVKSAIFGYNSARLYKLDLRAELPPIDQDKLAAARTASLHTANRSNLAYGYVARRA